MKYWTLTDIHCPDWLIPFKLYIIEHEGITDEDGDLVLVPFGGHEMFLEIT